MDADTVEEITDIRRTSVEGHIECSSIRITSSRKIIIICIYRPPVGDLQIFFRSVSNILHFCQTKYRNHKIVLAGDFNINLFNDNNNTRQFLDILTSFNLIQTVNVSTRKAHSLIDNVFVDLHSVEHDTVLLENGLSDHHGQILGVNFPESTTTVNNVNNSRFKTIISKQRLNLVKQELLRDTWDEVFASDCADKAYNIFVKRVSSLNQSIFVKKRIAPKKSWITNSIRNSCNTKRQLYHLKTKGLISKDYYNEYSNKLRKVIQQAKKTADTNRIITAHNKNKAMWTIINQHTDREKVSGATAGGILKNMKKTTETTQDLLNRVNSFFINCAGKTDKNNIKRPKPIRKNVSTLFMAPTCCEEVRDVILKLKNTSSVGEDRIGVRLIKYIVDDIQEPLTHIINLILCTGIFPEKLKIAEIKPIHKKGDKSDVTNYRPIALLPNISKVIEKIIYKRLTNFFEKHNILHENQNGFRQGKSTIRAAYQAICEIVQSQNNDKKTALMCLDLSKAFDCVEHDLLLRKLEVYGIRGVALKLIESYLSQRRQRVVGYNEKGERLRSNDESVVRGVPQGSVLGPLLFLIYVNDLQSVLSNKVIQYADDTSLIFSEMTTLDLSSKIRTSLKSLENWFSYNNLHLNVSKTSLIKFDFKNGEVLEVPSIKCDNTSPFLGITIDSRLDWKSHIAVVSNDLSKYCFALGRVASLVSLDAAIISYHSLVESRMRYGIILWINSSASDRVFIIQKRILRRILNLKQTESCKEYFIKHKILTLYSLAIIESIMFVKKNYEMFSKNIYNHDYSTRNKNNLKNDKLNYTYLQKNVNSLVISLYNKVPICWRSQPEKILRAKLKKILLKKAYYSINDFICDKLALE